MSRTAIPSVYPAEGVFEFSTIHVDLSSATSGARIHYTLDGSEPTMDSPVYVRADGLLPLRGEHGADVRRTLRAFAEADGREPSPVVTFTYRFCCPAKGTYRHQLLREPATDTAGLIRIEDFDLDKMYLLVGTERALLIDAGWDETGDLPGLCRELSGGLPVDLVVAHGHPDHIGQVKAFLEAGCTVYLPHADREAMVSFGLDVPVEKTLDVADGMTLSLGNAVLRVYGAPGHTPGEVVLLDEGTGDLFSSDAFGSNRRYVPDTAWLQISECSLESSLQGLERFLGATEGKLKRIFTGHNDEILDAGAYLTALQTALRRAVEQGEDALVPSFRSAAESFGSGSAAIEGDWRIDPIWAGANLRFLREVDRLAVPPRYAKGFCPDIRTEL